MEISKVLAGVAVSDLDRAKRWYEVLGRSVDAEPMPSLSEWHTPGVLCSSCSTRTEPADPW